LAAPRLGPVARAGTARRAEPISLDFRDLFEGAPDAYLYTDARGTIEVANRAAGDLLGGDPALLVGKPIVVFVATESRRDFGRELARWKAADRSGELQVLMKPWRRPPFPGGVTVSARRDASARLLGLRCLVRDVSERRRAEERLQASVRENQLLLREVHHRVKNNLQVISSLLSLQAAQIGDPELAAALFAARDRVATMAVIHDDLCRGGDLSRIEFGGYVERLATHLAAAHAADARGIRVILDVQPVYLGIDVAIPCGMIVNELLSNALEHAFDGRRGGEVTLELARPAHDECLLVVRDDGCGLPAEPPPHTLGAQLVTMLVEQLRGRMEVYGGGGTEFRIVFPAAGLVKGVKR
jgi:PAS domain S-box-containing protein